MSFQMEKPPEPIASDFVEMCSLAVLFLVGAPLNLASYTRISERAASTRLDILKRHLNYSDLLVIFIYVPSRGCWLLTYDWRGGDFLCRLIKFLHTFAFQISSNVIVCIALDRLFTVTSSAHHNPELALRRTRIMLWIAWVAAIVISAPQFAIWRSYTAFEKLKWSQCMQIWEILRAEAYFKNDTNFNAHALMQEENIYVILHMLLIFWLPAMIVMLCYLAVSCWVYVNSKPSLFVSATPNGARPGVSYHTGAETVDTVITRATAANPKIVINDEATRPLNGTEKRTSSATSTEIIRHVSAASAMRNSQSSTYSAKNRNRAIRVSFLLVSAYILCWLPYNALSLIQFVDPEIFNKHANKVYCLHGMMVFNSVINPYLYGLFDGVCRSKRRDR